MLRNIATGALLFLVWISLTLTITAGVRSVVRAGDPDPEWAEIDPPPGMPARCWIWRESGSVAGPVCVSR